MHAQKSLLFVHFLFNQYCIICKYSFLYTVLKIIGFIVHYTSQSIQFSTLVFHKGVQSIER